MMTRLREVATSRDELILEERDEAQAARRRSVPASRRPQAAE